MAEYVTWRHAPDLAEMAAPIIAECHPHLRGYPLRFGWRSKARKIDGEAKAGTAEIISGREACFLMTDAEKEMLGQEQGPKLFWVEISVIDWMVATVRQRVALLDHELRHCVIKLNRQFMPVMKIDPHDVEEFNDIVLRHGKWNPRLEAFAKALEEGSVCNG